MTMRLFTALFVSYIIGSFPTAYMAGKLLRGIDIRRHGSGNVGATNTFRVLGKIPGVIVLLIDVMKGLLPVTLIGHLFGLDQAFLRIFLGVMAVIGHNWTVFLRFKGGKGMATSLGLLIGLAVTIPAVGMVLLACLLAWTAVFLLTGYVSLASIVASVIFPLAMLVSGQPAEMVWLSIMICIFTVVRHRTNIRRLAEGRESRVRFSYLNKER